LFKLLIRNKTESQVNVIKIKPLRFQRRRSAQNQDGKNATHVEQCEKFQVCTKFEFKHLIEFKHLMR
jgi:uncharacterized Rmd1/YagE family protein